MGQRIAVHESHSEYTLRCEFVNDLRAGDHCLILYAQLPEDSGIIRFNAKIQFFLRDLFQLYDDVSKIDSSALSFFLISYAHQSCKLLKQGKVFPHHLCYTGTLNLGHDPGPIQKDSVMRLADGSRSQRFILEVAVYFINLLPGFLLDDFPHDRRFKRTDLTTEFFQLPAVLFRQHICSAGHDLTDLHISGTEIFQRGTQF